MFSTAFNFVQLKGWGDFAIPTYINFVTGAYYPAVLAAGPFEWGTSENSFYNILTFSGNVVDANVDSSKLVPYFSGHTYPSYQDSGNMNVVFSGAVISGTRDTIPISWSIFPFITGCNVDNGKMSGYFASGNIISGQWDSGKCNVYFSGNIISGQKESGNLYASFSGAFPPCLRDYPATSGFIFLIDYSDNNGGADTLSIVTGASMSGTIFKIDYSNY